MTVFRSLAGGVNLARDGVPRVIGFKKVEPAPGETRQTSVVADPRLLGAFDAKANRWSLPGGDYQVAVGASSADPTLKDPAKVKTRTLKP